MLEWCFEFARSACFAKASFSIFSNVSNSSTLASNWVIRADCFFKLRSSSVTLSTGYLHLFSKEDIRASWNSTIIWSSSIFFIANFQSELLSKGSVFLVEAAPEEYSAKSMQYKNIERHVIIRPTMRKGKLRTYAFMLSVISINLYTEFRSLIRWRPYSIWKLRKWYWMKYTNTSTRQHKIIFMLP